MNNVYAFIVGIEKYNQPVWDIAGPCANALAIAQWCLLVNIPPQNVFVFLDPKEAMDASLAELRANHVMVEFSGKLEAIDTFLRTRLSKGRPANSRLLFYWSGHGFVESDGTRIFICRDFTKEELNNRVFNASNFLRHLRTEPFQCFSEQIVISDVCGVYSNTILFSPDRTPPSTILNTAKQAIYFATPESHPTASEPNRDVQSCRAGSGVRVRQLFQPEQRK